MKTPRRLRDEGADAFEAELLRSARDDGASARRERTLAALGIGATTATGAGVAVAHAALGSAKALTALKVGLCLSLVAIGGATTVAVAQRHARHVATSASAAAGTPATATPSVPRAPSPSPAPEPAGVERTSASGATLARRPALPGLSEPAGARSAEPARLSAKPLGVADPLFEEVTILDEARRQLVSHDGAAAMRAASVYLARFPAGRLADEAQVIRIDAAFLIGGPSAALPLAESFLRDHSGSPHASAVRALLTGAAPSPTR